MPDTPTGLTPKEFYTGFKAAKRLLRLAKQLYRARAWTPAVCLMIQLGWYVDAFETALPHWFVKQCHDWSIRICGYDA